MQPLIIAFGEALWDLLPSGEVLGGAPFNFAFRTASLGNRSLIVSRLGQDELGRRAFELMRRLGMDTSYLQWDKRLPTGTVEVSFDEQGKPDYRIIENVAFDAIEPEGRTLELVRRADCLCFGTLIQRAPISRKTLEALLDAFRGRFTLLDINLRRNCYTPETIRFSLGQARILKMNEDEAPKIAGLYGISTAGLDAIASGLIEKADLDYCLITLGARGVFTAGFIHALLSGHSLDDCCRFGNALGALVSGQQGTTQPVSGAQIQTLLAEGIPEAADSRLEAFRRDVRAGS